jgi:hypothetical protein
MSIYAKMVSLAIDLILLAKFGGKGERPITAASSK